MSLVGAHLLKIGASKGLQANGRDLEVVVDGANGIQVGASGVGIASAGVLAAHLSAAAKQSALQSKKGIFPVIGAEQTNPSANNVNYNPGSGTYAAEGDTTKAILALLQGAGAANEFDTGTSKIGASATPSEQKYKVKLVDANGDSIVDGTGNEVWGILVVDARSAGSVQKIYFFSGAFSSAATAYTMAQAFKPIYRRRYDLDDVPEEVFSGLQQVDAEAAALAADQIKHSHVDWADVVGDGIEESGGKTRVKVPANAGLTRDTNGIAVNPDASTLELDGANALRLKALGITNSHVSASAAIVESKLADLGKEGASDLIANIRRRLAESLLDDPATPSASAGKGFIDGSGNEAKFEQLAAAGMAVRAQTAGVAYNHQGKRLAAGTTTSLAIGAADPTNPRDDIVVLDAAEAYAVRAGTPAGSPSDPTLTAGDVPLARVRVGAGVTTILDANITDLRNRNPIDGSKLIALSVATGALAALAVTSAKLAADAVTLAKFGARPNQEKFTADAGDDKYSLANVVLAAFYKQVHAYIDGVRLEYVATPATATTYDVIEEGGVTKVRLGGNLVGTLLVDYLY